MALDRQDIEKKDFPIGRRGYDPEAVDAHLRSVADQTESIKRNSGAARTETMAVAASEQVRVIVEAAETSAAEITRQAEQEARAIRQEAADDAKQTRDDAAGQGREHVARVSEAAQAMIVRVDAMESELGALVESLRTGANRLTADLSLLEGNMGELRTAASDATGATPVGVTEAEAAGEPPVESEAVEREEEAEADAYEDDVAARAVDAEPDEEEEPALVQAAEAPAADGDDAEGARLIALNMALNGTPREETDRYLAENFELNDREGLLNEVYARVGG